MPTYTKAEMFAAINAVAGERLPGRPAQLYWQASAVQNYLIGSRMVDPNTSRVFHYAQVGDGTYGATLAPTMIRLAYGVSSVILSNDPEYSVAGANALIGARQVVVTSIGVYPANHFQNGHLVLGAAGYGAQYVIASHGASAAGGAAVVFTLRSPLLAAMTAGDVIALYRNRYADVRSPRQGAIEGLAAVNLGRESFVGACTGVQALAGQFCWVQTWGPAFVVSGSGAEGTNMDERQLLWDRDGSVELVNIDYPLAQARQFAGYLIPATNTAAVMPAVGAPGGRDGMMYMMLTGDP